MFFPPWLWFYTEFSKELRRHKTFPMTNSLYSLILLKILSQIKSTVVSTHWNVLFRNYHAYISVLKKKQKGKVQEKFMKMKGSFISLLSRPKAEKDLLRTTAGKGNFSFFMLWSWIGQCQCCVENRNIILKAVQFSDTTWDELSKILWAIFQLINTHGFWQMQYFGLNFKIIVIKNPQAKCN